MKPFLDLLIGILLGVIFILIFFGCKIRCKTTPNIKINVGNFIRNTHIYLFDKHIHHWMINLFLIIFIIFIEQFYTNKYFDIIKGFSLVLVIHGLMYEDCFDM